MWRGQVRKLVAHGKVTKLYGTCEAPKQRSEEIAQGLEVDNFLIVVKSRQRLWILLLELLITSKFPTIAKEDF
ncbi:hypothetical protein PanWU01x14_252530 [Parasponia andersonii]|uniref:Uncharacterized protein n=1 Tax=Parasponia andersonii TaxID=3476 RepID=A0A2P5BC27_PARAD|nr:hypothetical protein PanWU01x14_252530 [Parasponia andersonii]